MKPVKPMKPMDFGPKWWPKDLGEPNTSGGQNDVKYAFFGDKHRLAIKRGDGVTLYDSGDHEIAGVSQQQGRSSSLTFVSQHGTVNVDELKKARTGLSQSNFAKRFGFSVSAVREWEQGRRQPEAAARVLLLVIAHHPEAVDSAIRASLPVAA